MCIECFKNDGVAPPAIVCYCCKEFLDKVEERVRRIAEERAEDADLYKDDYDPKQLCYYERKIQDNTIDGYEFCGHICKRRYVKEKEELEKKKEKADEEIYQSLLKKTSLSTEEKSFMDECNVQKRRKLQERQKWWDEKSSAWLNGPRMLERCDKCRERKECGGFCYRYCYECEVGVRPKDELEWKKSLWSSHGTKEGQCVSCKQINELGTEYKHLCFACYAANR